MRLRLVDNWKHSYKFASNWFHGAQIVVAGTWESLPADMKPYIPPKAMIAIVAVLGLCGLIARAIDQTAPTAPGEPPA